MSKALLKSTGIVSGMTLISRVLGFVRDMIYAQLFGAGAGTDAFFVAFRIPNFMRRLFAEGAFSQAFVPVFSQYQTQRPHEELHELVDQVTGTLGVILFGITAFGVLAAPALVWVFAPGFTDEPDKYALTIAMLRVTFPYLLFISLTALAGGVLNSCGKFAIPALTPVLLNICMIIAAVWVAPHFEQPAMALAWGVFAAGVTQLLFQIPYLKQLRLLPRPRWAWRAPGVQQVLKLMLPALFGSSVAQVNLLIDTLLASFLVTGSVSWLYYSDRLVEFPLGLFGVALGTVILPNLSRHHAAASPERFSQTLDWGLRWTLLIGLPATVALTILAGPILSALFQYGKFGPEDVRMAARSLMALSLGLLAFMLVKVLAPGFYARQDTRTPVRYGLIAMGANTAMTLILIWPLAHAGLALSTSLASFLNAGMLLRGLHRNGVYRPARGWPRFLWQVGAANLAMGLLLWFGAGDLAGWIQASAKVRLWRLCGLVTAGGAAYLLAVLAVGLRPRHLLLRHE
ncbi:MAG: murein biosynthesis integral membrane protein MurJ [Candidatus Competibacter sp.]|nr:murein biosynthesis integral membrane protein MurJ [Candidatus Competibacter sp.]MDG4605863.1 murein biosynthesis integral membrane protein MurJ [Candidatus Contendobacter sp.]HRD48549.1 murein biosynthesis integral membrane protein MurJ [Candidatus Contendobacter sp.]